MTQIKGSIVVNAFESSHCGASAAVGLVQARFDGRFFNSGPGIPNSEMNDVGAVVRLRRDSNSADAANVLRVQGTVYQCTQADCNFGSVSLGDVDLGTALVGETVALKLEWDQPNKHFNFFRGSAVQRVTYAVSDAFGPWSLYRNVGTRTSVPTCLAGRTTGFMDAVFDNIAVNASALP